MGKYSSDSDSEKRKGSYKSRKRRSSSSSSSDSRKKHKRKDRSRSRDRYSRSRRSHSSKSRRRSRSRLRDRHRRSSSRSKYRRSRSRSYIREYSSSSKRKRSGSSSSESPKRDNVEDVRCEVKKSPEMSKIDAKAISAINEEGFAPKAFTSNKNKKMMENIVIDLKKQTIKVPEVEPVEPDSIFHHNLFLNEEARMEKWIKELYGYRQKALQQGLKTGEK